MDELQHQEDALIELLLEELEKGSDPVQFWIKEDTDHQHGLTVISVEKEGGYLNVVLERR